MGPGEEVRRQWKARREPRLPSRGFSTYAQTCIRAHTHTHTSVNCSASLLPTWIAILRVCVCVALFAPLYPAIHRRVRCTRPKERHGHSENRRAGQTKKKSYPEWREDGYSARKLEIDGGSERAKTRDIVKCRAAEGIYRDLMSRIGRVVLARPVRQS